LHERYADDREALAQEAAGLPFFKVTRIEGPAAVEDTTRAELRQTQQDAHKNLNALVGSALLREVHPELRG